MRLCQLFLATMAALHASTEALPETLASHVSTTNDQNPSGTQGRSLRHATTLQGKGDTEERGLPLKPKLWFWLNIGRADAYVEKKLGLKGLEEARRTEHPNFQLYEQYKAKNLQYYYARQARKGFSTYKMWKSLGLDKITDLEQLRQGESRVQFEKYVDYVLAFDKHVENTRYSGYYMPEFVDKEATAIEKSARAVVWAMDGKSDVFVREMLGLQLSKSKTKFFAESMIKNGEAYNVFVEETRKIQSST